MRVLITGGVGFIGSHVAQESLKAGHEVILYDNFSSGNLDNVADFKDKVTIVKGDILDLELLKASCQDVDWVSHQAALRSVPRSVDFPQEYNEVNIKGTFNVLEAARLSDVKRVTFASSSSVYGDLQTFPAKEDMKTYPVSPYAITKLAGEHYMNYFFEQYGMQTASLRYFNVFGQRQSIENKYAVVVPLFITRIAAGQPIDIHWDGEQSRDFTHVTNNALANLACFNAKKLDGQVFNICEGKSVSVNEIARQVQDILGKQAQITHSPKRAGDVRKSLGDTTKAKEWLDFQISIPFKEGLKKTVEWFTK